MNPSCSRRLVALLIPVVIAGVPSAPAHADQSASQPDTVHTHTPSPVERLGPDLLRIGNVHVNTARKEISVTGAVTGADVLEFIAVAKGGFKSYESALELDTTATNFNVALILIGLDPARGVVPKFHIDPALPDGDPVELWVEWQDGAARRKIRVEQLVYNTGTKQTLSEGPWVYTGSVFSADSKAYLAELEGSLIGFVHTPAPVIESPRPLAEGSYGNNRLNPQLNLKPGTSVTLTVRALPREKSGSTSAK